MKIIDLTHTLSPDIPSWDGDSVFSLHITGDYTECVPPNLFRNQKIETSAGAGTHIDAPAHCIPGGKTIDALDIQELTADCIVIRADGADENHVVMPETIERFEKEHGTIPSKTFVAFHTGWDTHWNDPKKYRNELKFPSIHESTAQLLLKRGIVGIGIDTLSVDARGIDFPTHRAILGAGKYIVENIAHLESMPTTGGKVFIFPPKIKDATEAPVRLIGLVL